MNQNTSYPVPAVVRAWVDEHVGTVVDEDDQPFDYAVAVVDDVRTGRPCQLGWEECITAPAPYLVVLTHIGCDLACGGCLKLGLQPMEEYDGFVAIERYLDISAELPDVFNSRRR